VGRRDRGLLPPLGKPRGSPIGSKTRCDSGAVAWMAASRGRDSVAGQAMAHGTMVSSAEEAAGRGNIRMIVACHFSRIGNSSFIIILSIINVQFFF
jgi:hypothetical protein